MVKKRIKLENNVKETIKIENVRKEDGTLTIKIWNDSFDFFLKQKLLQGLSDRTLRDYKMYKKFADNYFQEYLGLQEYNELKVEHFVEYISYMKFTKEYANNTINIRLRYPKAYLTWLYDEELIDRNISKKIKLVKTPADTVRAFTDAEVRKLLKVIDKNTYRGFRDYTFFLLILDTGIRVSEALNLTNKDIDLTNAMITVQADNSKTNELRYLPVSFNVISLLRELRKVTKSYNDKYAFVNETGDQLTYNAIRISMDRYKNKAGLDKCTLYMLRHTFATNAVKQGIDTFTLQKLLGHKELATSRKYVQLNKEFLIEKKSRINTIKNYIR